MSDLATVSTRAVAPVVAGLRAAGADVHSALSAASLSLEEVSDPEGWVPHERVVRLWSAAVELTNDPEFGLKTAGLVPPGAFGVVEYALRKSPTVREGLERVSRYFRLGHDVARLDVSLDDDNVIVEHTLPGARTLPRAPVDFILSVPVLVIRDATDGAVSPVEVWVDYGPPDDKAALEERFAAPVKFLRGKRALVFSSSDASTALTQSEPGMCAIIDQHARQLLRALPTIGTFADRVRELLAQELSGGDPTAQGMARALKMSVRTLHRRLTDEGTSHKVLLEKLRTELAGSYLRDQAFAISEVAYLLGFSEPSAFHRAFRRWMGKTPAEFRTAAFG